MEIIPGRDDVGRGLVVSFAPTTLSDIGRVPTPLIVSDAFLEATGRDVGDALSMSIGGISRFVNLAGSVHAFPATDVTRPVVVMDLPTLALLQFEGSDAVAAPNEWWLAVEPDRLDAVTATLQDAPLASESAISQAERARALSTDPVALGVIGAFAIGFIAAAVFAVLGFVVNAAVSARERVTEFALLTRGRAVGQAAVRLALARERRAGRHQHRGGDRARPAPRLGRPALRDRHPAGDRAGPAGRDRRALDDDRAAHRAERRRARHHDRRDRAAPAPARAGVGPADGRGLTCA